jgi:putative endonuclease
MSETSYTIGVKAEAIVASFYESRGYVIIARRHRNSCGEIDVIALKGITVVFVEVKQRKKLEYLDLVSKKQMRRYLHAADLFMAQHLPSHLGNDYDIRFDIAILENLKLKKIIPNAWNADYL